MRTRILDTEEASNKWFAYRDAQQRNYAKSTHYSDSEKIVAERMKLGLDHCYHHNGIYINYRDRFIAVKVTGGQPKDKTKLELMVLEADYEKRGIVKAVSKQGIIYRVPKKG